MALNDPNYKTLQHCTRVDCPIDKHCEMPKGQGEKIAPTVQNTLPNLGCDYFYPVADLRGEGLRFNPSNQPVQSGWDPQTKRIKRRRQR